MAIHYIKAGDTLPTLQATLKGPDGLPFDLTGKTATLYIRKNGTLWTRPLTTGPDPTAGIVSYAWVAADWTGPSALSVGKYKVEYSVLVGSDTLTFPNAPPQGNDTGAPYDTLLVSARLA